MTDVTNLQDKNGVFFDPEIHQLTRDGKPWKQFGRWVLKTAPAAEEGAQKVEVIGERINPALDSVKMMNAVVENNESDEQKMERFRREAEEEYLKKKAAEEVRHKMEMLARKAQEINKYKLDYNLEDDLQKWAEARLAEVGGKFAFDKNPDGSFKGTFHMWALGRVECCNIHQPLNVIRAVVDNFCRLTPISSVQRVDIRSTLDGSLMSVPLIG